MEVIVLEEISRLLFSFIVLSKVMIHFSTRLLEEAADGLHTLADKLPPPGVFHIWILQQLLLHFSFPHL